MFFRIQPTYEELKPPSPPHLGQSLSSIQPTYEELKLLGVEKYYQWRPEVSSLPMRN